MWVAALAFIGGSLNRAGELEGTLTLASQPPSAP